MPDGPEPTIAAPAPPGPVVVPRWIQLVLLPLAVLGAWALARAAGPVLLVFVVAGVIALILNPLVRLVQRAHVPRGVAVLAVYIGFFTFAVLAGYFLANPIADQVSRFQGDVPRLVADANAALADVQEWLDERGIDVELTRQGETALETLQDRVLSGSGDLVAFGRELLTRVVEAAFALILVIVISVYFLLYAGRIGDQARRLMPPGDGTPQDDYPSRVQHAVFDYVRGQLTFSLVMGASAGAAMWLLGVLGVFPDGRTYALFFGAFFGLMELVPYVGPVLGALPPIAVALLDDPLTAVWVGLTFLALQQLEGHIVAPQVFGHSLRINPLLVIFALLLGGQLYGIIGALMALPIAAVVRETALYLREHLVLEPWDAAAGLPLADGGPPRPDG